MSLRSIVLVKEAGIIIGKGGSSVKEIRERACARINISEQVSGVPDRVLTVSGPIDTIAKAYSLVAQKLIDDSNDPSQSASPQGATIRLLVPHTRMGSVIGKGGSKIKEIQEASGAKLNASEEMLPNSTERTITVVGVPDAIHIAVYHIAQILQEYMDRPLPNHIPYRPQPRFPMMYGPMPGMSPPPAFYGHPGPHGGGYPPMPPMNREMGGGPHGHSGPGSQSQQIFIPNDMVGCIIGKGGSKINEIRHMSGSHIKIAEPQGNTNERLVTITGTPESNQMALYLLYNRLESEKGRMGGW
ncbi:hypothetical protein K493DRAFT_215367 [Basidiobolus meristosporus CBS 931.73]|uniref:K Homology domain-containing protein n=1 Tax=Basidiobolus meristosporus CBS 931.73 TaxID=1314790 RepID=A0A1Y1YIC9_9FUNG|nr:hypothetical protein K493DRAFT_215367 [Basidiobolus meristosporus CBS 931.73]|eukprot:ORX97772.1 hypothetical protein K493DRAFT_215367 [Basidiobolus meristosporus CBS 931.73]